MESSRNKLLIVVSKTLKCIFKRSLNNYWCIISGYISCWRSRRLYCYLKNINFEKWILIFFYSITAKRIFVYPTHEVLFLKKELQPPPLLLIVLLSPYPMLNVLFLKFFFFTRNSGMSGEMIYHNPSFEFFLPLRIKQPPPPAQPH